MPHVDALSRGPVEEQGNTTGGQLDEFPDRLVLALTFDRAGLNQFVHKEDKDNFPHYLPQLANREASPLFTQHLTLARYLKEVDKQAPDLHVGSVEIASEQASGTDEEDLGGLTNYEYGSPPRSPLHSSEEVRRAQQNDAY